MAPNVGQYLAGVDTTEGADRRHIITDDGTAGTTELPRDDVTAAEERNQLSTGVMLPPDRNHTETGYAFGGTRLTSIRTSWNAGHPGVSDRHLEYFVCSGRGWSSSLRSQASSVSLRSGSSKFEKNDIVRKRRFDEMQRRSGTAWRCSEKLNRVVGAWRYIHNKTAGERQYLEELRRRMNEER